MDAMALALEVHRSLDDASVPHAFGGALAFGYYAETRATQDADVSVFVDITEVAAVVDHLSTLGLEAVRPLEDAMPISGIQLRRPETRDRCDLFPDLHPRYAEIRARVRTFPFGVDEVPMPFLDVQDVVMFKLSFGRPKDWVDLQSLALYNPDVDIDGIADLLVALRGPTMHPRLARVRRMLREAQAG